MIVMLKAMSVAVVCSAQYTLYSLRALLSSSTIDPEKRPHDLHKYRAVVLIIHFEGSDASSRKG